MILINGHVLLAKKAYYQRSILYHPDRFATENEQQKLEATRKFQIIGRAYCILSDSDRKSIYDATGSNNIIMELFAIFN